MRLNRPNLALAGLLSAALLAAFGTAGCGGNGDQSQGWARRPASTPTAAAPLERVSSADVTYYYLPG